MAKTAAEQADELRLERERVGLEREQLELEEVRESTTRRKAERAQLALKTKASQQTLAIRRNEARNLSAVCSHRQGGESGKMFKGKGPTALKVEKMPDGFTVRIRCLNCPLRVTNPLPSDNFKKLQPGETPEEQKARLARFQKQLARFNKYYEMSQEGALTSEAAQPMEPGTTFKVTDAEGHQIFKPRPSDSYAVEMDMEMAVA